MTTKTNFLKALLLLILCVHINSCRKYDTITRASTQSNKFSVEEAKEWFYGTFVKSDEYKSLNKKKTEPNNGVTIRSFSNSLNTLVPAQKYPSWKMAITDDKSTYSVVEMPYASERKYYEIKNEVHSLAEKQTLAHYSVMHTLFIKDNKGTIFARSVQITPDSAYLRNEKFDITHNSIAQMDNDFSGWVIISAWNGDALRKFKFKNGKIVKALEERPSPQESNNSRNLMKVNSGGSSSDPCYTFMCYQDLPEFAGDEPFNCRTFGDCDQADLVPVQVPCPEEIPVPPPNNNPPNPNDPNPNDPPNNGDPNPNDPPDNGDPTWPPTPIDGGWDDGSGWDNGYGNGNWGDPFDLGNFGNPYITNCYYFGLCYFNNNYYNPYGLSNTEQIVLDQLKLEDDLNNAQFPQTCYGTKLRGNINFPGTLEHYLIQDDYVQRTNGAVYEYSIPEGSTSGSGYRGRADLANEITHELFEIKPVGPTQAILGEQELFFYVIKAKQFCSPLFRAGTLYTTRVLPYPKDPTKSLKSSLTTAGVIQYQVVDKATNPYTVPLPAPVPQNILDRIKTFVIQLIQNPNDIYEKTLIFLRNNPDIAIIIKNSLLQAAAGIIVGTIIEDVLTSGAGLIDDIICFRISYTLVRVATKL